jgi:hypothetical protein
MTLPPSTQSPLWETRPVSGVDVSDGERFVISDVRWDGTELHFTSLMPSTSYELMRTIRVVGDGVIEHQWQRVEIWHKKASGV